jgi:hypothetical protein
MKKTMIIMAGVAGASLTAYVLVNKKTRKKAEKLFDSMMDEADNMIQNQGN